MDKPSSPTSATAETPRPLRALHLGKYYPPHPGGMETYLRDLLHALSAEGVRCTALVHASQPGIWSTGNSETGETGAPRVVRAATWGTLLFTPLSLAFPWQLWRLIREERPHLLHLHMPNVSVFWALFLPATRRLPWVVHWHADVPLSEHQWALRLFYRVYRPFERWVLRRARIIISTSPAYRDSSPALAGVADKCRVVPLGLKPPEPEPPPVQAPGQGPLRVLAVGRLTYYKGFEVLLRALAHCPDARLDLVGEGEERDKLQALAELSELRGRVTLHGQLSDPELASLLQRCDCLCLPSIERTEAFGMVLLEAMARGKACIATAVPGTGMAWVVEHDKTGLVVPPGDPIALADAIKRLSADRRLPPAMGRAGQTRFMENFKIQASASGILRHYRAVTKY